MPCTQTGSIEGDRALHASEQNAELSKQITHLTKLLCEACGVLEEEKEIRLRGVSGRLQKWWSDHQKIDAQRRAKETEALKAESDARRVVYLRKIAKRAIQKAREHLTVEEQDALAQAIRDQIADEAKEKR